MKKQINNAAVEKPLDTFTAEAIYEYGTSVIEERALADFHDGLKPVQRKLLWAAYNLGLYDNKPHAKSARITGETMGKYHPHAEAYGVLVNMANSPQPLIDGAGNWGTLTEGAAAPRYTNARLSKYAMECFFNPRYTPTIDLVPNYDNKEVEPVFLPASLPNLFVNGSSGIAVAITANIPSFCLQGLVDVCVALISKKDVKPKHLKNKLVFNLKYGGVVKEKLSEAETEKEKTLWDSNAGTAYFEPEYQFDKAKRELIITGVPPGVNPEPKLEKVKDFKEVDYVSDALDEKTTTKVKLVIQFKRSCDPMDLIEDTLPKIVKLFSSSESYKININNRQWIKKPGHDYPEVKVGFIQSTILDSLKLWSKHRVELEVKALNHESKILKNKLEHLDTLLIAVNNIKVIVDSLTKDDQSKFLQKKLKITEKQADVIMDMKVRNLSKMSKSSLLDSRKELVANLTKVQQHLKNPEEKTISELKGSLSRVLKAA